MTILEKIQNADPKDIGLLDEIDKLVDGFYHRIFLNKGKPKLRSSIPPQYTRSLDASKSIQPEGWNFECNGICNGTFYACLSLSDATQFEAWYCKTEELARLHVTVQALEFLEGEDENDNF
jgi:hypothetical protein